MNLDILNETGCKALEAFERNTTLMALAKDKPEVALEAIVKLIAMAAYLTGQDRRIGDADLSAFAKVFLSRLPQTHPGLYLEEVYQIVMLGVEGKFGEFYGINYKTLIDWTNAYYEGKYHNAYLFVLRQEWAVNVGMRQIAQHCGPDDNLTIINGKFGRYREQLFEYRQAHGGKTPLEEVFAAFDIRPGLKRDIGDPLWDFDGQQFSGTYARFLNDRGLEGITLKEQFDNLIRRKMRTIFEAINGTRFLESR